MTSEESMTNDTRMTEEKAREIVGTKFPSRYWDGKSPQVVYATQCQAQGYLQALEDERKRAEGLVQFVQDQPYGCKILDVHPEFKATCKRCNALSQYAARDQERSDDLGKEGK